MRERHISNNLTLTDLQRKSIIAKGDSIKKHLQSKSNPVFNRYKVILDQIVFKIMSEKVLEKLTSESEASTLQKVVRIA